VRDAGRAILFTGVLKPGETYRVPDRPGLSLRAGGLNILIDGKPAPPLGPPGYGAPQRRARSAELERGRPGPVIDRPTFAATPFVRCRNRLYASYAKSPERG
jgi:hypothetical protein